jgi:hypothetical protein
MTNTQNTTLNTILLPVIGALASVAITLLSTNFWLGIVAAVVAFALSYVYTIIP